MCTIICKSINIFFPFDSLFYIESLSDSTVYITFPLVASEKKSMKASRYVQVSSFRRFKSLYIRIVPRKKPRLIILKTLCHKLAVLFQFFFYHIGIVNQPLIMCLILPGAFLILTELNLLCKDIFFNPKLHFVAYMIYIHLTRHGF